MSQVQYLGHGQNTGGLQRHSIGSHYPWIIVGYQADPDSPVVYYAEHAATGRKTTKFSTAREAIDAAMNNVFRDNLVRTLRDVTGLRIPSA